MLFYGCNTTIATDAILWKRTFKKKTSNTIDRPFCGVVAILMANKLQYGGMGLGVFTYKG